jgi:hypothetical protein
MRAAHRRPENQRWTGAVQARCSWMVSGGIEPPTQRHLIFDDVAKRRGRFRV